MQVDQAALPACGDWLHAIEIDIIFIIVVRGVGALLIEPAATELCDDIIALIDQPTIGISVRRRLVEAQAIDEFRAIGLIVIEQAQAEGLGRCEEQLGTAISAIRIDEALRAFEIGKLVEPRTVAPIARRADPEGQQIVDDRTASRYFSAQGAILAQGQRCTGIRREAWTPRGNVDLAGAGLTSARCALRAARHIDLLDVDQIGAIGERQIGIGHAIDCDAEGRIDIVTAGAGRDTPHGEAARARIAVIPANIAEAAQRITQADLIESLQFSRSDDGNGLGNVLEFPQRFADHAACHEQVTAAIIRPRFARRFGLCSISRRISIGSGRRRLPGAQTRDRRQRRQRCFCQLLALPKRSQLLLERLILAPEVAILRLQHIVPSRSSALRKGRGSQQDSRHGSAGIEAIFYDIQAHGAHRGSFVHEYSPVDFRWRPSGGRGLDPVSPVDSEDWRREA